MPFSCFTALLSCAYFGHDVDDDDNDDFLHKGHICSLNITDARLHAGHGTLLQQTILRLRQLSKSVWADNPGMHWKCASTLNLSHVSVTFVTSARHVTVINPGSSSGSASSPA